MPSSQRVYVVFCASLFTFLPVLRPDSGFGQTNPVVGLRQNTPEVHALIHARIVPAPGRAIEKGTIIVRDGVIMNVGADVAIPADARTWDYAGMTVYPGLIDGYSQLGIEKKKEKKREPPSPEVKPKKQKKNKYWNPAIKSEVDVLATFRASNEEIKKWRDLGFTSALVVPQKGILRGTSALINLGDGGLQERVILENVAQHLAYETSSRRGTYPSSLMGAMALIRQAMLDADWYQKAHRAYAANPNNQTRPESNETLASLSTALQQNAAFIFEVESDQDVLRSLKLAREFGLNLWLRGSGHEYRVLSELKQASVPVFLPVSFPPTPKVETPEEALSVSLQALSHWETAPANPAMLQEAGIAFALTTAKLEKPGDFPRQLRKAIEHGLPAEAALAALTTTPAKFLGVDKQLGTIERGKLAHLLVADGELFDKKTEIIDVWITGKRYKAKPRPEADPRGTWELTLNLPDREPVICTLEITGKPDKLSGKVVQDTIDIPLKTVKLHLKRLSIVFPGEKIGVPGIISASGKVGQRRLRGQAVAPDGRTFAWQASWQEKPQKKSKKAEGKPAPVAVSARQFVSPPGAYGRLAPPEQPAVVLVRGATIWTCGPQGKLDTGDLLIKRGKIAAVGENLRAPDGAIVVQAHGKHVTPGLIDAHSHSGITRGVNEVGQAVTAEVGIGDVVNSHDIAFYRELAGGLTTINQLHGSANPIGGKNSVIKLLWGARPDEMAIKDAIPGIKFALGENVKQSNWGDRFTTRYPQTRMGVEQLIRDRFNAALDYEKKWQRYQSIKNKRKIIPPRRDLELETLLEIIHGKRLVHSHSYRQDEILMLVRIADDFGFTIGTFQHVLEGYKIAEALAEHGAGASTFSDWWAYKFEVYDAIPYNGALMHNAGVVVSFNSDSGELARRLNLEAAKAVKYGGISQEEALKFVTLNPARQLRIDHRVGSLQPGKDGDFVIWSGPPLSTYTRCEQTWIDGRKYFDLETDTELRRQIAAERARIIQKALKEGETTERQRKHRESPN